MNPVVTKIKELSLIIVTFQTAGEIRMRGGRSLCIVGMMAFKALLICPPDICMDTPFLPDGSAMDAQIGPMAASCNKDDCRTKTQSWKYQCSRSKVPVVRCPYRQINSTPAQNPYGQHSGHNPGCRGHQIYQNYLKADQYPDFQSRHTHCTQHAVFFLSF